jgi:hypothetical protein
MSRWVPHQIEDKFACRNLATDELLRGWRKGHRKLIWRGTLDEAVALCVELEKKPPPVEQSKSQVIMHVVAAQKRRQNRTPVRAPSAAFKRCESCGSMYKTVHECSKG